MIFWLFVQERHKQLCRHPIADALELGMDGEFVLA